MSRASIAAIPVVLGAKKVRPPHSGEAFWRRKRMA